MRLVETRFKDLRSTGILSEFHFLDDQFTSFVVREGKHALNCHNVTLNSFCSFSSKFLAHTKVFRFI
ncbi:hypothetical protein L596_023534 [Steinernema carpocapsae]|uniref:Uncharacterized protein n=1 Tax=Steinernema carpocapsae TaxID=34508 RepID=A0A4U5ME64_STECR|nr:hypothetical protein L596_023534 [Steinernema carpocapsae]